MTALKAWAAYETLGVGLHEYTRVTGSDGREWDLNYVGVRPQVVFDDVGEPQVVSSHPFVSLALRDEARS